MTPGHVIVSGGPEILDDMEPLWNGLRAHVCSRSVHFGEEMRLLSWEERKKEILGAGKRLLAEVVSVDGTRVAYCVSSVDTQGAGEVDSIYVDEGHRGMGLGHELVDRALSWMERNGAKSVRLSVTWGNEEVLQFYQSHSFYPRSITLQRKDG
ncbi:MAG: GNAT family N-acetyltransferase [Methanomassiliicoccales archaeon]|jgi:ribosomal protein S18 acetylase RimI-like enzyme|nr:GNAT family N-acetyltransferase [Methanomassiliicoccales archaeon]